MCLALRFNHTPYRLFGTLIISGVLSACSLQRYTPAPLDITQKNVEQRHRNFHSPELNVFLKKHQSTIPAAGQAWSLPVLVKSALFFHPDLALAKASYRTAELQKTLGKRKPTPNISTQIARSNRANGDIDPFALSLSIDLPIQTNDKQTIRVERLSHLSEIAKLDVAQTAWQIQSNVMQSALTLYQQEQEIAWLKKSAAIHQSILSLLEKRMAYGEASRLTLNQAEQSLAQINHQLLVSEQGLQPIKATLAQQIGVSANATADITINHEPFERALASNEMLALNKTMTQRAAMVNHLGLRKALLQYAVAEQSLKLEYAKQIPDIVLSPGYAFEFGDSVWSLGFNSLMTLLQKNKVGIAQATQLRNQEVAQFDATQHKVISTAEVALAEYQAAFEQLSAHKAIMKATQRQQARLKKQFEAGLIGRLALTQGELSLIQAEQNKRMLEHKLLSALLGLEAAMQTPILLADNPFESIESLSQSDKSAL